MASRLGTFHCSQNYRTYEIRHLERNGGCDRIMTILFPLRIRNLFLILFASVSLLSYSHYNKTASTPALAGIVTSVEEGPMEGVLVSAKRYQGTITVTVVSNAEGRYYFSPERLPVGSYRISIRATGYELRDPTKITITANKTITANLKLQKTTHLPLQLMSAEWLMSVPGTEDQKRTLYRCV